MAPAVDIRSMLGPLLLVHNVAIHLVPQFFVPPALLASGARPVYRPRIRKQFMEKK